jgi:WS/DGAT/MGAT family acyltransferase
MRQLSEGDALFISSESAHANSNVSLVQIYDPSTAPGGRFGFRSFLALVESRLHRSPIFRQKLRQVPLGLDEPYWVEDDNFDLEYHVRHIALPKPGDWRQFCIQASRIHARPLDLNRPLWEIYVIEGLDSLLDLPRDSFALLTKLLLAAIDVERGTEIITLLHDTTPEPPQPEPPEPWFPESPPSRLELVCRGIAHTVTSPSRLLRPVGDAIARIAPAARTFVSDLMQWEDAVAVTRFNSIVSPYRVFETRRFLIDEFREIRGLVHGAKVNDAILAVCAGALRRYLAANDELPEQDLSTLTPVYVRESAAPDGKPEVRWVRLTLGTDIDDPVRRLAAIKAQTAASKLMQRAIGARELTDLGTHAPAATLALTGKMLGRALLGVGRRGPLANCAITNVPGPSVPFYLNGARMTYFSAIMPINDGMGLVFAVTSYDGKVIVSPTSCREQMPDPEVFAQCVRDSFQEYLALARRSARESAAARRRASSARPGRSSAGTGARAVPVPRTAATVLRAAPAGRRRSRAPAD